jgi:hypothetical protein
MREESVRGVAGPRIAAVVIVVVLVTHIYP